MKIDVTQVLKDYKGKDILADRTKEKLILRDVIILSLNAVVEGQPMTAEDKSKAFQVSVKVSGSKSVNLTTTERAFILERVAVPYSPLVYGRVGEIFGDKVVLKKEKEVKE